MTGGNHHDVAVITLTDAGGKIIHQFEMSREDWALVVNGAAERGLSIEDYVNDVIKRVVKRG